MILKDDREFRLTEDQYKQFVYDYTQSKSSEMFKLLDPDTWEVIFEWLYGAFKEFKHTKKKLVDKGGYTDEEIKMMYQNRNGKQAWTAQFKKENPWATELYHSMAEDRLESAIEGDFAWPKFVQQMADVILRQENNCPFK